MQLDSIEQAATAVQSIPVGQALAAGTMDGTAATTLISSALCQEIPL